MQVLEGGWFQLLPSSISKQGTLLWASEMQGRGGNRSKAGIAGWRLTWGRELWSQTGERMTSLWSKGLGRWELGPGVLMTTLGANSWSPGKSY